jgi:hypothetical protein
MALFLDLPNLANSCLLNIIFQGRAALQSDGLP